MNQYQAKNPKLMGATLTSDPFEGISLDRENEVKRVGYRSASDQIMELTRAGQRLVTAREEQYSKPTGLLPRHYGEIDPVVGKEKTESIRETLRERKAKQLEESQQTKAAEPAAKAEKPAPEGGGVT